MGARESTRVQSRFRVAVINPVLLWRRRRGMINIIRLGHTIGILRLTETQKSAVRLVVEQGQRRSSVAALFGVSVDRLMQWMSIAAARDPKAR